MTTYLQMVLSESSNKTLKKLVRFSSDEKHLNPSTQHLNNPLCKENKLQDQTILSKTN